MKEFAIKHPVLTFFGAIIIIPAVFASISEAVRPQKTSGDEEEDPLLRLAGSIPDKK